MAENSKIEWTDHTVNLWWGCAKVNAGCKNCYAEELSCRFGESIWGEKAKRKLIKSAFPSLAKYQRKAKEAGEIHKIFIGSMMDIFEEPKLVMNPRLGVVDTGVLRNDLFQFIDKGLYPDLFFLFLTKRPENINKMIPEKWKIEPPTNVAFGASVSTQEVAAQVFPHLGALHPNANVFISMEPMLEKINLDERFRHKDNVDSLEVTFDVPYYLIPDWIIVGGESGNKKRPFDAAWARDIRDQCKDFSIPFFMKQMDKKKPVPEDLMIREIPSFFKLKNLKQ